MLIIIPKVKSLQNNWLSLPNDNDQYQVIDDLIHMSGESIPPKSVINDQLLCMFHGNILYQGQQNTPALEAFIYDSDLNIEKLNFTKLNGDFLLFIYDRKNKTFIAGIDKLGKSDCYYSESETEIIISSSLKNIQALPETTLTINPQAIFNYLYFHCIPSPLTIYNETLKLEAAHLLEYSNNKTNTQLYWKPNFSHTTSKSIEHLSEELKQKLTEAISNTHLTNDTGSFLSGGLDSSTITGIFSELMSEKVDAYTMGFKEAGYDETEFAETAAKHFNVNLNHYYVTPQDVAGAFSSVIQSCEEPFGNSSIIPTYLCAKFAKDHGKTVLLAGDGGDELFAGNERYLRQLTFNHYDKVPTLIKTTFLEPLFLKTPFISKLPFLHKVNRYIEQAKIPMPERMETYNLLNQFPHEAMFEQEFLQKINTNAPVAAIEATYRVDTQADFLQQMLYADWKFTLSDNDLKKVNIACRLAGIDVKFPFLEENVVEFSSHIPSSLLIKNNTLRYFYKEAVKDFLPNEIINKKKHGFGLPFGEWLKKSPELQNHIYKNLNNFKSREILSEHFIDEIIDKHRTEHAGYYGVFVWIIAALEEWLHANVNTQKLY